MTCQKVSQQPPSLGSGGGPFGIRTLQVPDAAAAAAAAAVVRLLPFDEDLWEALEETWE